MNSTRTQFQLLAVAVAIGIGTACTNSGLGQQVGTTAVTDSGTTTIPTAPVSLVGTWDVSAASCGTFGIDNDWFAVYPQTTMDITDTGNGDGTYFITFRWSNSSCAEVEQWEITETDATQMRILHSGITQCDPADCTFFPTDETCTVGARSQGQATEYEIEESTAGFFRIVGLLAQGYPQCTLDLKTEWTRR